MWTLVKENRLLGLALASALSLVTASAASAQNQGPEEPRVPSSVAAPAGPVTHPELKRRDIPAIVIPAARPAVPAARAKPQKAADPPQPGGVAASPPPAVGGSPKFQKFFPYTVRPGDSLGRIAESFGIPTADLTRVNGLHEDDELLAGETLKIPNPFEAERKTLEDRVKELTARASESGQELDRAKGAVTSLTERNAALESENSALKGATTLLPWWRRTALGVAAAGLLTLGVTVLTLFEWWVIRRRFVALSEFARSLSRLDVKYKEMLAKAELRMQQLYGRRRQASAEDAPHTGKTAEEIEMERLDHELKQALEAYLERLGVRTGGRRRSRWREALGIEEEPPVEARSLRR